MAGSRAGSTKAVQENWVDFGRFGGGPKGLGCLYSSTIVRFLDVLGTPSTAPPVAPVPTAPQRFGTSPTEYLES